MRVKEVYSYVVGIGLVLVAALLVACQSAETPSSGETAVPPSPSPQPTAVIAEAPETATATNPAATATPATETGSEETAVSTIDNEEAEALMQTLLTGQRNEALEAVERIVSAGDERFIAVFIELFRGRQIGLVRNINLDEYVQALETLSGQSFGPDWPTWIEWYGGTGLQPPPGFTDWKGRLLSIIDPAFRDFLRGDAASTIRVEEILWGGVRVDGIPALDNPEMLAASEAGYLNPEDAVFGIKINDDARAYPLRILDWHEMANDVVGGVPVSLAYCTLCGAAIAYDGRASNGQTYTFGSSGFLFRSNKLMYDRQTRTLWNQLTGEPVLGELVDEDVTIDILPVVLTTWEAWREMHPNTLVVDVNTGYPRDYAPGAAYGNYFAASDTMFPVWQRSDELDTKEQVFTLRIEGIPKAYPIDILTEEVVANDTVGDTNVVLVAPEAIIKVDGVNQYIGAVTYEAGAQVRAYDRGDETFAPGPDAETVLDAEGQAWQVTEEALVGPDGERAPRLGGHLAYWFGWYAFFPNTLIYEGK